MTKLNTTKSRCCCLYIKQNMFNMNVCSIQDKEVTLSASSRVTMGWLLTALLLSDHMFAGLVIRLITLRLSRADLKLWRAAAHLPITPHSFFLCVFISFAPLSLSLSLFLLIYVVSWAQEILTDPLDEHRDSISSQENVTVVPANFRSRGSLERKRMVKGWKERLVGGWRGGGMKRMNGRGGVSERARGYSLIFYLNTILCNILFLLSVFNFNTNRNSK